MAEVAPTVAAAYEEKVWGDPADYTMQKLLWEAPYATGQTGQGEAQDRRWLIGPGIQNRLQTVVTYEEKLTQEAEAAGTELPDQNSTVAQVLNRALYAVVWQRLTKLRDMIAEVITQPNASERIMELPSGTMRDFFLFAWHEQAERSVEETIAVIEQMRPELGDGAKLNRAQDVMNRFVQANYERGTSQDGIWATEQAIARGHIPDHEIDHLLQQHNIVIYEADKRRLPLNDWHAERKQAWMDESEGHIPPSRYLFLFSDTAEHKPNEREVMLEPSYKARLMARVLNPRLEQAVAEVTATGRLPGNFGDLKQKVRQWIPEQSLFRDFYLENILHMELWARLQTLPAADRLRAGGVQLITHAVDLKQHFGTGADRTLSAQADTGNELLSEAYMLTYPVIRVEGLETHTYLLSIEDRKLIADFFTDQTAQLTPVTAEVYERAAVQLEIDHLQADYAQWRAAALPTDSEPSNAEIIIASHQAFERVIEHITLRFPKATHHRDTILLNLMTDLATTPEQMQRVERLTYGYMVRHPAEETPDAETPYSQTETVRNYIAMFPSRGKRREVLTWLFGGMVPDDRFLEGVTFNINEQEKVELFWSLSTEERKAILYSALMGQHGLFDVPSFEAPDSFHSFDKKPSGRHWQGPSIEGAQDFFYFLEDFYYTNFAEQFEDAAIENVFRTAFFEAFCQYSTARRIELFLAIAERMKEVRDSGEELTAGQVIELLLSQVGVVGINAGQVLSEQGDTVPDDIKQDLSSLKDEAAPFSKRGVSTYLQQAGLFTEADGRPVILEIGDMLGSASIKQVHRVRMTNGEDWAVKVMRPTILRNYKEDFNVLQKIVEKLRTRGYEVPSWLLTEIRRAVDREMDFALEAQSATEMREKFHARSASMLIGEREVPISVPEVKLVVARGSHRMASLQVVAEEYSLGMSLQDIIELQHLQANSDTDEATMKKREKLDHKLQSRYGDQTAAVKAALLQVDIESFQAQLAIELLYQISLDDVFHADLHSGNVHLNLLPGHEQVDVIDAGSSGHSRREVSGEMKPVGMDFLEIASQLLLSKTGFMDARRLAILLEDHVRERTVNEWEIRLQTILAESDSVADVFRTVLSDIFTVNHQVNDEIRFLMKALVSGAGHLEALQNRITRMVPIALQEAQSSGRTLPEVLAENMPEARKLLPLLPAMPAVADLLVGGQ